MTDKDLLLKFLTTFNIPKDEDTRISTMRLLLDMNYRLVALEDKLHEISVMAYEG